MIEKLTEHKGKASFAASGGLSIGVAMMLFVSVKTFEQHCDNCAQTHQQLQDVESKLDEVRMFLAKQGLVLTDSAIRGTNSP